MKSLPRTPCQSTESTITATMMAKAFQNNHHKRGLSEMMAPPPTPTGPQPNSYLDCQSLQSSLKRVRLSSSPGELRLQRDLRHMVSSGSWVPKQPQGAEQQSSSTGNHNETLVWHPPAPPVTARPPNPQQTLHIELQQVESLRLRLTFQHSVVAWIQIPRMYPHRPPLISRIVYNNNNDNDNNNSNSNAGIQSILVHEAPPSLGSGESTAEQDDHHDAAIQCANTVVYRTWSPVQRLGDLLDFVIQVFQKQHQEMNWSNHSSTQPYQSINDVSLTYSSSSLSSNSSWSRRSSNSSITSATTSGYRASTGSVFPGGWINPTRHATTNADMSTFLTPNRFDMGYDRAIPPMTMDVDHCVGAQGGIPQQVSMMDL